MKPIQYGDVPSPVYQRRTRIKEGPFAGGLVTFTHIKGAGFLNLEKPAVVVMMSSFLQYLSTTIASKDPAFQFSLQTRGDAAVCPPGLHAVWARKRTLEDWLLVIEVPKWEPAEDSVGRMVPLTEHPQVSGPPCTAWNLGISLGLPDDRFLLTLFRTQPVHAVKVSGECPGPSLIVPFDVGGAFAYETAPGESYSLLPTESDTPITFLAFELR